MDKILTLIIPSYNMEAYLPKCLGSLVVSLELMDKLEVIVVNDGSKDRTSEIAHEFEAKYPGAFKVIDKENGHYGSCVNAGLAIASGVYVKILDADDSVDTLCFGEVLQFLDQAKQDQSLPDVVITDWVSVDPNGQIRRVARYESLPKHQFSLNELNEFRSKNQLWIGIHAIVYRRTVFNRFNYQQTEGCSYTDTEWLSIPMAYVKTIRYLPICVTKYLVGRDGQSMDPKVFARDFHVLSKIAFKMVNEYSALNSSASEEGKMYLSGRIVDLLHLIYSVALFGFSGKYVNVDLKAFDLELKKISPFFFKSMDNLKFDSKRFDYYFVKDWRVGYSEWTVKMLLCKAYICLRRIFHLIKKKLMFR